MISLNEASNLVTFTQDEKKLASSLEGGIDAALHSSFDGGPVRLQFEQVVSPKVAHAVKRKYEELGGWKVNLILNPDKCAFVLVPEYSEKTAAAPKKSKELPRLDFERLSTAAHFMSGGTRLHIVFPTRGRAQQALEVLTEYRNKAGCPVTIEVVVDDDDKTMQDAMVLQRLNALGCILTVGRHKSKIAAVNGGRYRDWDIVLLASDDMLPVVDGYGLRVIQAMEKYFPHFDGAVFFDDGHQGKSLCTLPIIGRRLHAQMGNIYAPEYVSLFCDLEQSELLTAMGRLQYIDEKIIEHRHHIWGLAEKDELYEKNDSFEKADEKTYKERKAIAQKHSQFAFDAPPLWLSICIASVEKRRPQLNRLVDYIYRQMMTSARHLQVEVLVDDDEGSIGEKRNRLLKRARGHYVCSIDDDDWIAHNYISRVVRAVSENPDADCVALKGVMTTNGEMPERFEHSLTHAKWETKNGVHLRSPNHLNAIRREIALSVGFPEISHGEDHDFSTRIRPLLKKEISVGDEPLYFYWFNALKK